MVIGLTIIFFIVAILLMVIVLIQPGSSGGMGIFGQSSQSAFGTKTGNVLTKFTTILAALFLIISFFLGYLNSRAGKVEKKELQKIQKTVKELPKPENKGEVGVNIGVDVSGSKK